MYLCWNGRRENNRRHPCKTSSSRKASLPRMICWTRKPLVQGSSRQVLTIRRGYLSKASGFTHLNQIHRMVVSSTRNLSLTILLLALLPLSWALKFDISAHLGHNKNERCIRNFVQRDTLVVVTAISDGSKGDGQVVDMHVRTFSQASNLNG